MPATSVNSFKKRLDDYMAGQKWTTMLWYNLYYFVTSIIFAYTSITSSTTSTLSLRYVTLPYVTYLCQVWATGIMRICGHADLRIEQRVKCGSECGRKSANYPPARVAYWPLTTDKMRIRMRTLRSWNNVICFNLLAVCIYYFLYHLMVNKDCRVVDLLLN